MTVLILSVSYTESSVHSVRWPARPEGGALEIELSDGAALNKVHSDGTTFGQECKGFLAPAPRAYRPGGGECRARVN